MDFDRFQPDAYTKRLGALNKVNRVTASDNICNAEGAILIAKGSEVSPDIVKKIFRHRLNRPFEEQVALSNSLSADELFAHFKGFLSDNEEYAYIDKRMGLDEELRAMCQLYANHPLLVQKLTVFCATIKKNYFDRALFCAWFALILAAGMKRSPIEKKQLFLAALFQDIGLLHLDNSIIAGGLRDENTRAAYESHPLISATFMKAVPHVTDNVAAMIMEHHENSEGTGYPRRLRKRNEPLSEMLQLVNVLFDLKEGSAGKNFSLRNLQPLVKLKGSLYGSEVYSVLNKFIANAQLPDHAYYKDKQEYRQFVSQILMNHSFLANWFQDSIKVLEVAKQARIANQMPIVAVVAHLVWRTVSTTGVLSEGLVRWISHVEEVCLEDAAQEMLEVHLLQQELLNQLSALMIELERLFCDGTSFNEEVSAQLGLLISNMKSYEMHLRPESLVEDTFNLDELFG